METDDMVHLGFGSCRGALAPSTARAASAPAGLRAGLTRARYRCWAGALPIPRRHGGNRLTD